MNNLYEIIEEYKQIEQALIDSEGELTDELAERLALNENEFSAKMEAYAKIIRNNEAYCLGLQDELDRLEGLMTTRVKLIDKLKERMRDALLQYGHQDKKGIYRYDTDLFRFSSRKSSSVNIFDESKLPSSVWVLPPMPEPTVSKKLVKDLLDSGTDPLTIGAEVITKYSIQIK